MKPDLPFEQDNYVAVREDIREDHSVYVSSVSSESMAVSLETAAMLHAICDRVAPKLILDLGSGFSSYILRRYAAKVGHGCHVVSIDDSSEWLEKSREYVQEKGLDDNNMSHLSEFSLKDQRGRFDLVFHDIGNMKTRRRLLKGAWQSLRNSGLILLDDCHKVRYRSDVVQVSQDLNAELRFVKEQTTDRFGRYAAIGSVPGRQKEFR